MRTESEKLSSIIIEEKAKDHDAKFEAFERKMDKKHSDLCANLQNLMQDFISSQAKQGYPATFAKVVGQQGAGGLHAAGVGNRAQTIPQIVLQQHTRSRSPSVKRQRAEDGGSVTVTENNTNENTKKSQKPKPVVGTSDSIKTGRKMRSPPADIFVWGVHPDTTKEDIVNDLAESNIIVKISDIEKKSKDEAYLCSYRISVPATDLDKALDPAIWPLRVKVREFVHYAKRAPKAGPTEKNIHPSARVELYTPVPSEKAGVGQAVDSGKVHEGGVHPSGAGNTGGRPKTVNLQVPMADVPLRNMFELLSQLGTATL